MQIDAEYHHLDLIAHIQHVTGLANSLGPGHFRNMHQAFNAGLQLHKGTVFHQADNPADNPGSNRIASCQVLPGIRQSLLDANGHLAFFTVKLEYLDGHFLTGGEYISRLTDTTPGDVRHMQQSVHTAQVHKRAVFSQVFNHTLHNLTFGQMLHGGLAGFGPLLFQKTATGQNNIAPLLIEADHLEFAGNADIGIAVTGRTNIHLGGR